MTSGYATRPAAGAGAGDGDDAAALAARHGLHRVGTRPPLRQYLREMWQRRHFVRALATATAYGRNQNNYLGQLWAVLTPLFLAAVYLLVFGVLLGTRGGVENYVGFLTVGIFMFTFAASSLMAGSKSITGNIGMVRALHFPRAVLPVSAVLAELATVLPAVGVLLVILLVTGETPTWSWLLFPPALLLLYGFSTGAAFVAARLVVESRDLLNLIPLALRFARYVSGVFFSIEHYVGDHAWGVLLEYQPLAVYLSLVRSCLLEEFSLDPALWIAAGGWALGFLVVGFLLFWQREDSYGRG